MTISKQLSGVGAFALCISLLAVGHADTPAQKQARREIAAAYKRMDQGLMRKDLTPYVAPMAPDFQSVSAKGVSRNREQDFAQMRLLLGSIDSIPKSTSKIISLVWRGPDAVGMCQSDAVLVQAKREKIRRVEQVTLTRDYWSHNAVGWQIRQSVAQAEKVWANGKRIS